MGVDTRRAPPLPAPTESESFIAHTEEVESEVSASTNVADEKSHYSLPDDGTPVTIKTRGHRANKSQTSLLIEYFEGGKTRVTSPGGSAATERKPSVRVRLTPSKARGKNDHIQITETRSTRKGSMSRRATSSPPLTRSALEATELDDDMDMSSYASATEESNVSRHPIEVEIDPGSGPRRTRRRVSSPLIPAADSKASYLPGNMSDISAIPTDSFLDGSGPTTTLENIYGTPLGNVPVASAGDRMNRKQRGESHEHSLMQKAVDKASKPEKKHRSKSRTASLEKEPDYKGSPRRKSRSTHKESVVSAADSSVLSSQLTPSYRSYDSHSSSKISINNPKLLETVEDAIRRLILPELDAIKRERSQRDTRRSKDRESLSSLTSREDLSAVDKRRSADTTYSTKSKSARDREARNDLSPHSSIDQFSYTEENHDDDATPRRTRHAFTDAALGAAVGAAALRSKSRGDEKRQRRRRRAETPKRDFVEQDAEHIDEEHKVVPPMPLSSEINPSELTRTSILSADTDRPHSASEEMMPVHEVARGVASMESMNETPTPTRSPERTLQGLGTQHANISHGDLRALPRQGLAQYQDEYEEDEFGHRYDSRGRDEYEEDYDEGHLAEPGMYEDEADMQHSFYASQDVPAPLRYVPYQAERRGLSPIQSVSGYTEGGESEVQGNRDSRSMHTTSEISSPDKRNRDVYSPNSIPSNMRSREFGDEASSVRSSGVGYRNSIYTEGSELDPTSAQAVKLVSGNARVVHQNFGPESAVASLVDGSVLDPSLLSGSGAGQHSQVSQLSYDENVKSPSSRGVSPEKRSVVSEQSVHSPSPSRGDDGSHHDFSEYEINEYGQKVPKTTRRHSPTTSETAITAAALSRAAAAALKRQNQGHQSPSAEYDEGDFVGEGVSRNRSFKERAKNGYRPDATPRHSVDRLSEYSNPKLGASGVPDFYNPEPEFGYGYEDDHQSDRRTPSATDERHEGVHQEESEHWREPGTPTQEATEHYDRAVTPKASKTNAPIGLVDAAAAATLATAGAMAASHSRQPSQDQDDDWQRTSGDRKRDTLVTNPYEGASPIANLPGLDNIMDTTGYGADAYRGAFHTGSPGLGGGDEGYISAAPNDGINNKGKGPALPPTSIGNIDDPFYAPNKMHLSGMSQGMRTPLFDGSTGTGIDRIENKDIIALMEHLMVRDAQRSARDTEILVTLVRSAADMRNSFDDIKRMLADTEEQIIGEVNTNTEISLKRHLGGPRPFPGSGARSVQGASSQAGTEDLPTKKRNLLRRALQGLSAKGTNDLGRIEDMLMQLLTDVDVLKHQTAGPVGLSTHAPSLENLQPEIQYEQDRGYEPEGNAGTSTASHASQSGHLSIPQSRGGASMRGAGSERKFSDHRISTVPEDEGEYEQTPSLQQTYTNEGMLSPPADRQRGGSVPLGTPPQTSHGQQFSASSENTPRTEDSKKHKSKGSKSFFPKISRWSETTASSIGKAFRSSGSSNKQPEDLTHPPPSRSGSDLADFDPYQSQNMYSEDKLHSGFSQPDLLPQGMDARHSPGLHNQSTAPMTYATPEDPKYRAHRDSLNLQHPQPRPGQTERFRTALETSAADYDTPMSPRSADFGSVTSLNRYPQNTNRYSDNSATNAGGAGYNWEGTASPASQGPPRPPKEPLDTHSLDAQTPPQNSRVNKLQKKQSPLPFQSVESGYGTATATHFGSHHSGSPRLENRNLSGALGVPTRRPSGPRAMTPSRGSDDGDTSDRRRKRDTFGTVASPSSALSQESETF